MIKRGREHPNKGHDIGGSRIPTEDLSFHTCEISRSMGYSSPYFHDTEGPVIIRSLQISSILVCQVDCRSPSWSCDTSVLSNLRPLGRTGEILETALWRADPP